MVRPILVVLAALAAACTAPAYTCGHPVPCARGTVQSCTSRDGVRCRYRLSDDSVIECASCDDCFAAEREIAAWCASDASGTGGDSAPDLAGDEPRDLSVGEFDLAAPERDLSTTADGDMSLGQFDTDLGCYTFGYQCDPNDPTCCAMCCAGGCTMFGWCALQ